jgi:hypothetical protein
MQPILCIERGKRAARLEGGKEKAAEVSTGEAR